jgi:ribosome biogenesis protein SSF1/2
MARRKAGVNKTRPNAGRNVEKRAVKLVELGPRLKMRMVKVEEGLCEGRVMWHEFVKKTQAEQKVLEGKWAKRREEKEQRRKAQKENVERKKELRRNTKANGAGGEDGDVEQEEDDDDDDEMDDGWDSEDAGEDNGEDRMEE